MIDKQQATQALQLCTTKEQLEWFFQTYLWKNWLLNEEFKKMLTLPPEEKKIMWGDLSDIKAFLTESYEHKKDMLDREEINAHLANDPVDSSLTGIPLEQGNFSLLAEVRREVEDIFRSMWFTIEYGTDMVTKFENFEAVNIPLTHPATEMQDTIYLNDTDTQWEHLVLRTHTSSMQNYMIKKHGVPLKILIPWRAYRVENMDATHDVMFYQVEWMYIWKNISIAHFKWLIDTLLTAVLKKKIETRMRPWYFPFVEPWFEIDARYEFINPKTWEKEMSSWLEILPWGMIHPNVLKAAGVDPKERSWFAFWLWMSRLAAIKYGIKDIRLFTNGDLRFAKSF